MNRGTVNVVLRVKPREDLRNSDRLTVCDSEKGRATVILKKSNRSEELFQYQFYRALEHAGQEKMYQICGEEVIRSCLDGYNGTIMAYGQTGAGKTYTMYGDEYAGFHDVDFHGIMPRAIQQVFCGVQRCLEWRIRMTFVEIYNETFRDLLSNSRSPISVQDATGRGRGPTTLKGVTPINVRSIDQAFELLVEGQEARSVAAHAINDRSSRSHAILTLWIEITQDNGRTQKSKLNMVDLAGSERTRKTGATGSMAKEATYINKSLSCLALVAKELRRKSSHVHYRDSKLTHYLRDSVGGNCRTLMIACVWGDANHLNESISTCRFADDIQQVEVNVSKNSGVQSVHRNLFKLNPAMTKYIDQMMAKRVAQEKAKLFRDLKRRGLVVKPDEALDLLEEPDGKIMSGEEYKELEALRRKVKELEEMEATKRKWGLGFPREDSFEELTTLRKKVADLEAEKEAVQFEMARRMKEAESSLLEEMQELRVKVCELQKIRALTHSECSELYALRERMAQVAGRRTRNGFKKAYKTWHPNAYMSNCDMMVQDPPMDMSRQRYGMDGTAPNGPSESESTTEDGQSCTTVEDQARVVGQLEGLRDRLRELHDVAVEKLTQDNFQELSSIRDKILTFQSTNVMDPSTKRDGERGVLEELEEMRRRLKELQSIPVDEMTPDDLRELATIKDKILSLQNNERVRDMIISREMERQQPLVTSESAGLFLESSNGTPPSTTRHPSLRSQPLPFDIPQGKNPVPSPRDHSVTPTPDPLPFETSSLRTFDPTPFKERNRQLSYIPPFPGCGVDPAALDPEGNSETLTKKTVPSDVGGFPHEVGCLTQVSAKSETKLRLRDRMGQHFWNLVSLGKFGGSQEKQREKSLDETANIVILNSLTHSQVLELLRDRYASRTCMGSFIGQDLPFDNRRLHTE